MVPGNWVLLLYGLPTRNSAERVSLWRKLKRFGALPLKTSAYILPDEPVHYERFHNLAQAVRANGGEASLIRVMEIEGMSNEEIARLFNEERASDYAELMERVKALLQRHKKRPVPSYQMEVEKLHRRFHEIRQIDYFGCPAAHQVEQSLEQAGGQNKGGTGRGARLDKQAFRGRGWVTLPRPRVGRVGSAWLIRTWIDPKAKFLFAPNPADYPEAIPYDVADTEFSNQAGDCTFETLLKRFRVTDHAALRIGEMIHDADREDGKFQRHECVGLDCLLRGWARMGLSDQEILGRGLECFEALYQLVKGEVDSSKGNSAAIHAAA